MASNQNAAGNEDIVDTIAQYDLDEDFPDYANEQNKELNQIVSLSITNYCQICMFYDFTLIFCNFISLLFFHVFSMQI